MSTKSRRARRAITSRCGVTIRRSVDTSRLVSRISRMSAGLRLLEHRLLELVDPVLELLDLRPVVIDHRVDDPVEQRDRSLGHDLRVPGDVLLELGDRSRVAVVDRDEVVRADEEVDVVRGETLSARLEVDAVQDRVQVAVVRFDLRVMQLRPRVLDRQRMEPRTCRSGSAIRESTARPGRPRRHVFGRGIQPGPIDARGTLLGLAVRGERRW